MTLEGDERIVGVVAGAGWRLIMLDGETLEMIDNCPLIAWAIIQDGKAIECRPMAPCNDEDCANPQLWMRPDGKVEVPYDCTRDTIEEAIEVIKEDRKLALRVAPAKP